MGAAGGAHPACQNSRGTLTQNSNNEKLQTDFCPKSGVLFTDQGRCTRIPGTRAKLGATELQTRMGGE